MSEDLNNSCCTIFLFYQFITLSSRAEGSHQMYSGGSVVGKATIINPEISLTFSSFKFHRGGGSKNATFDVIFDTTQL